MLNLFVTIALMLSLAGEGGAGIINGGFESGLSNIQNIGLGRDISTTTSLGAVMPTEGKSFLYLSTGPGDQYGDGNPDSVDLWMPLTIEQGIKTLSIDVNVLTGQAAPSSLLWDSATVTFAGTYLFSASTKLDFLWYRDDIIIPNNTIYKHDAFLSMAPTSTPNGSYFTKQTGWYTVVVDVSELAGLGLDLDLCFSAQDNYTPLFDTALLIDNIKLNGVNPVPIPPAVWLLGSGLIGLVGVRRRF